MCVYSVFVGLIDLLCAKLLSDYQIPFFHGLGMKSANKLSWIIYDIIMHPCTLLLARPEKNMFFSLHCTVSIVFQSGPKFVVLEMILIWRNVDFQFATYSLRYFLENFSHFSWTSKCRHTCTGTCTCTCMYTYTYRYFCCHGCIPGLHKIWD